MKAFAIDAAITMGLAVLAMTIVNRTPLRPYVSGEAKILGVV